ncbi:rhodanese-like domain-containing protein 8, chloroplastic isoform X2 [Rhodamnia argentea]|uniref:Rhodanese-like domain-containing protein 8, chloroplastic isoform X2 n=1 Tax=Rhodamnia argentea TaxID=178133 RepID=A0A8B8Q273_9MYRT|nr:rhodanese-like domain-containing protein 8, chloroplastic isoform X2 [Rhodamnia argentea]
MSLTGSLAVLLCDVVVAPTFVHLPRLSTSIDGENGVDKSIFHYRRPRILSCSTLAGHGRASLAVSPLGRRKNGGSSAMRGCAAISSGGSASLWQVSGRDFVVVNLYRFVCVDNPEEEVAKHLAFLTDLDIHGRIYLNEQGINAQYSGPLADARSYFKWLREDDRFSDILIQISPALSRHAFPKLKVQFKPLVQVDGGIAHLPLLDPSMRATPLVPSEWKERVEGLSRSCDASSGSMESDCIILDLRNGYEWDIGHFRGARRPEVDCFRSTSFGLSETEINDSDPLADVDKEKTDVLMYCTGGIRCDVYSTILRQKGFKNLYTLRGGVSHYLENEGPVEWVGNLFVFDSRLSLPPSAYNPKSATQTCDPQHAFKKEKFAKCYLCSSVVQVLRHRNCANLDCNLLFLCCPECVSSFRGCCCSTCMLAPRLRPILPGHQRYKKWHLYRDMKIQPS